MSRYAEKTSVSSEKSKAEIERTLARYGASSFMSGWQENRATLAFDIHDRRVRFDLPLPDRQAQEFTQTPGGRRTRSLAQRDAAYEQAIRQRWRALALAIKAKLEAVEAGITEFEDEFLAHIVLPNGTTAGDWLRPQIAEVYEQRKMPALLPYQPS
jgi:hypothetical protein